MLERMDDALSGGLVQVYDPYIDKDIVPNQHHDFDNFLTFVDMVVIMVGHNEIKENMEKLNGKVVFDTRNICVLSGVYRL
jgi:UDP-N-acetyl-D-mannosaminuronic acid dehydrogenase